MIDPSQVTIVIPHLGATKEEEYALDQCLQSIYETCDIKVILVKNGFQKCRHYDMAGIQIWNQGQCKAVNAAAATLNTPWIFVTNDDMIYAPGWWGKLTDFSDPSILCISPKLIEPIDGAPTFEKQMFGGAGGDFDKETWLEFAKNYPSQTALGKTGFNLPFLIKKELWDLIGGYDINYDPWGSCSDTDLECKIALAGVQPYQNTNCIVYHFSQTSGTFLSENQSYWAKNYAYFEQKWGYERPGDSDVWVAQNLIKEKELIYKPWWKGFYEKKT